MGPPVKGQMFPVFVLLSRSQMLEEKQTRTVLGGEETSSWIWMPHMTNAKEKMVSFLSCCWQRFFLNFFNNYRLILMSPCQLCSPSRKEAQSGAHVEHWPCARPVHVWQWVERRRGTVTWPDTAAVPAFLCLILAVKLQNIELNWNKLWF